MLVVTLYFLQEGSAITIVCIILKQKKTGKLRSIGICFLSLIVLSLEKMEPFCMFYCDIKFFSKKWRLIFFLKSG